MKLSGVAILLAVVVAIAEGQGYGAPRRAAGGLSRGYGVPQSAGRAGVSYATPQNGGRTAQSYGAPRNRGQSYGAPQNGYGATEESFPPQPYEFQYEVKDDQGNDYAQQEESDGSRVEGQYRVLLPDSRTQTVTYYVEGDSGFVANVEYEGEAQFPDQNGGRYGQSYGSYGGQSNPVYGSQASNFGYNSRASSSSYGSRASNGGYNSQASSSGYGSRASNGGYNSQASSSGYGAPQPSSGYGAPSSAPSKPSTSYGAPY